MILLIDKPKGLSSHDVVDVVRKKTGERKVGHGGTLDPNATGLLIVGVGRASTKQLGEITQNTRKTYEADIFFGEERDTDDVEGKVRPRKQVSATQRAKSEPSLSKVKDVLKEFEGEIAQIPPKYSAVKMGGKKAYELARKGKEVVMQARKVKIYKAKLVMYEYPLLKVEYEVSSGTYIRALARDLGRKLGCGAYLANLRRTRVGEYDIRDAVDIMDL